MIEKVTIQDFNQVYELMEMSFPSDEYRPYDEQQALLHHPAYAIYGLFTKSRDMKAFVAVWDFDEFAFIEHFAVNPQHRNGGIGSYILSELLERLGKTVCLEVEPPETEIARRRIGFYQRNHFFFNAYPYTQPPISHGKKAVPLYIMTSGSKVDEGAFEKIKGTLYAQVYNKY